MAAKNVRKSIADAILNRVLGGQQVEPTAVVGAKDDGPEPSRSGPTPPTDDVEIVYVRFYTHAGMLIPDCKPHGSAERVQNYDSFLCSELS